MKAVLVICEGRHDTIFVQRSLGSVAGCTWFDEPIRHLPSPFGSVPGRSPKGLVARRMEREVDDLKMREAAYPVLPQYESAVVDDATRTLFVIVRANGKKHADSVTDLLREVNAALDVGPVDVTEYAAAFLFDANRQGLHGTLSAFRTSYQQHFGDLATADHAHWLSTTTCHAGVFVVHRSPADQTGTLEDHVAPMVASTWPQHYAGACAFVDDNRRDGDAASRNDAARLKAIITSAAQFRHPGHPLATVIAREGIPAAQFDQCELSRDLVRFLQAVPWRDGTMR